MSLKELRQHRGLTQQQLADKANVPRTRIAEWESDSGRSIGGASLDVAIRVGDALRVSNLRKLLEDTSPKEGNAE